MERFIAAAAMMLPAVALAVTPAPSGTVGGTTIVVNSTTGDQDDPHVSGDLAAYTDKSSSNWTIRYFNFLTNTDSMVPSVGETDLLSDVSNTRIAFSRVKADRIACMVYDVPSATLTEVAAASGTQRFGTAIGNNTVAFVEFASGNGDIFVADLPAGAPINVSASLDADENPAMAPSGDAVVWMRTSGATSFDIMKSVRTGGVWGPATVVSATIDPEENPDTDGTTVVYDSTRATGRDIFMQPLSGGAETRLELEGSQANASISAGIVAFESVSTEFNARSDIYVYQIASNRLFQVTDTPAIGEHLNDVSVLADGSVRVVWAADESNMDQSQHDIFALTFNLPEATGGAGGGGGGGTAGGTGGAGCGDDDDDDDDDDGHHDDDDDDDDDDCNDSHHNHHGHGHSHHGNGHGYGHCKPHNHGGHGHGKHHKKGPHHGWGSFHGSSHHHLDAAPEGAQGCSASGGVAPMLIGLFVLAFMLRRPAPVRVRRK